MTPFLAQSTGSTLTTFVPQLTQEEPSPFSTGGIVFFIVVAILLVGALTLYLRNRRTAPRS